MVTMEELERAISDAQTATNDPHVNVRRIARAVASLYEAKPVPVARGKEERDSIAGIILPDHIKDAIKQLRAICQRDPDRGGGHIERDRASERLRDSIRRAMYDIEQQAIEYERLTQAKLARTDIPALLTALAAATKARDEAGRAFGELGLLAARCCPGVSDNAPALVQIKALDDALTERAVEVVATRSANESLRAKVNTLEVALAAFAYSHNDGPLTCGCKYCNLARAALRASS